MTRKFVGLTIAAFAASFTAETAARDYIAVVGSSTVFPFETTVVENFGRTSDFKTPTIES